MVRMMGTFVRNAIKGGRESFKVMKKFSCNVASTTKKRSGHMGAGFGGTLGMSIEGNNPSATGFVLPAA